jgi:hypothetical protein
VADSRGRLFIRTTRWLLGVLLVALHAGCAPSARLTFPRAPLSESADETRYDIDRDGRPDFALLKESGRVTALAYDDDEDGRPDRVYRLADYPADRVPHLILLLDSIPYQQVADRYIAGDFRWLGPPQKVISPFPSLTEQCFTDLFRAPPLPGVIDTYYKPGQGRHNGIWDRVRGHEQPWERRLDYHAKMWEQGLAYLNPRPWHAAEMQRVRQALDDAPDRVCVAYVTSASGMMCKFGATGCQEILDDVRQLCLQILHDRRGAVKISILADHGHNLMESKNVRLDEVLRAAGFRPGNEIRDDADVVVEINGLVTYAGVHTRQPARVATTLLTRSEVELAMYQEGDAVIVRNASGSARIECKDGHLRYTPIDNDVLGYQPILNHLKSVDGFVSDDDWFAATVDHPWPDAPRRIWDAFHGRAVTHPTVMVSLRDGSCAGLASFEKLIKMASSHGGLNQVNSATFVMTMTGRVTRPLRTRDVLQTLEPGHPFSVKR